MKIYFVRHGESEGNKAGKYQSLSTPLSELGRKQAHAVAKRFEDIDIDFIISSDYNRAHETALIIGKQSNLSVETDTLLRERKRPTSLEGLKMNSPEARHIKQKFKEAHLMGEYYEDEEKLVDLIERGKKFVKKLETYDKSKTLLVVSHGEIIRTIIAVIMDKDSSDDMLLKLLFSFLYASNTGISLIETFENEWILKTWNDCAHVEEV